MIGGAFIGAIVLTLGAAVAGDFYLSWNLIWQVPLAPIMFAGISLIFVVPCTLIGGIPTALLVRGMDLKGWPSFIACIGGSLITLAGWNYWADMSSPRMEWIIPLPFALGAGFTLWWQLTPPAGCSRSR